MEINKRQIIINSKPVENDQEIVDKALFDLARDRQQAHLSDVEKNGQPTVEEAYDKVVLYLSEKHKYETKEEEFEDKKELAKALRVIYCNEFNIKTEQVPFLFTTEKENNILIHGNQATALPLKDNKNNDSEIVSLIAIDKDFFINSDPVSMMKVISHEFGHIRQDLIGENQQTFVKGRTGIMHMLDWNASPAEKDADAFAFNKLLEFIERAEKGKTTGALKSNKNLVKFKKMKSEITHWLASLLYPSQKQNQNGQTQTKSPEGYERDL